MFRLKTQIISVPNNALDLTDFAGLPARQKTFWQAHFSCPCYTNMLPEPAYSE
jgi:hypothetical protein